MSERVVPVCNRADYRIGLEQAAGRTWAHLRVHHWSARVARQMARDGDAILALHGGPIYATSHQPHGGNHAKLERFVRQFGFDYLETIPADGMDHRIYVRRQ